MDIAYSYIFITALISLIVVLMYVIIIGMDYGVRIKEKKLGLSSLYPPYYTDYKIFDVKV